MAERFSTAVHDVGKASHAINVILIISILPYLMSSLYSFMSVTKIEKLWDCDNCGSILSEYIQFPLLNNKGGHILDQFQGGVEGKGTLRQ